MTLTLLLVAASAFARAAASYTIQAEARPKRLVYGDDNRVTLSVRVTDAKTGAAVPDGTSVFLYTTLGALSSTTCYTQHGEVSALLDNATGPGKAYVTITVGDTQETLMVEYLGQGGTATGEPTANDRPHYRLNAQQVYFSADRRVFDLRDQAIFTAAGYTITAGAIQYDVQNNLLTAQSDVAINAGSTTITGEKLRLDLAAKHGAIVLVNPSISYLSISLPALTAREDETARKVDFTPLSTDPTHTWIVCHPATAPKPPAPTTPLKPYAGYDSYKVVKRVGAFTPGSAPPVKLWKSPDYQVIVYPGDMVLFRRPKFYLTDFDHPLFSLPYHVLNLRMPQGGTIFNSELSLTSDAGLNVDFPFYYMASGSRTGALHFRRVTKGSPYFRGSGGFQIDLEEEYLLPNQKGDGGIYCDDLTRPTRSITWDHNQTLGSNAHLSLSGSFSRYNDDTPYTTRGSINYSRTLGRSSVNLRTNMSQFEEHKNAVVELYANPPSLPIWPGVLSLGFSPYMGYEYDTDLSATTNTQTTTNSFYQGFGTSLALPTFSLLGCTITTNASNELSRSSDGVVTDYVDLGASARRSLFAGFSTSLSYGFSLTHTFAHDGTAATTSKPSQHFSLDLSGGRAQRWNFYAYSSYTLDSKALYSSLAYTYYPPFDRDKNGNPRWFARVTAHQTSGDIRTIEQLLSIGRNIGLYTLVMHVSPTGNTGVSGIGSGTGKAISIELQRQGW